jgi:hypothetical protein
MRVYIITHTHTMSRLLTLSLESGLKIVKKVVQKCEVF